MQLRNSSQTVIICTPMMQIVDREGGAECSGRLPKSPADNSVKRRFQRGSVDEVSFAGPNLGPLAAVMLGPEEGGWQMEEVVISNSREAVTQRFVGAEAMGSGAGQGAALLTPVPPDSVVYGSGDSAVFMTQVWLPLGSAAIAALPLELQLLPCHWNCQ
jgi:hypothetical protein